MSFRIVAKKTDDVYDTIPQFKFTSLYQAIASRKYIQLILALGPSIHWLCERTCLRLHDNMRIWYKSYKRPGDEICSGQLIKPNHSAINSIICRGCGKYVPPAWLAKFLFRSLFIREVLETHYFSLSSGRPLFSFSWAHMAARQKDMIPYFLLTDCLWQHNMAPNHFGVSENADDNTGSF